MLKFGVSNISTFIHEVCIKNDSKDIYSVSISNKCRTFIKLYLSQFYKNIKQFSTLRHFLCTENQHIMISGSCDTVHHRNEYNFKI